MNKKIKANLIGATFALAGIVSTSATAYLYEVNPYAYTNKAGCTWQSTGSTGGSWGVQFYYNSVGACQYNTMQVTITHAYSSRYNKINFQYN